MIQLVLQDWVAEWQAGTFDRNQEALDWMRSRPATVKVLMVQFPPSCLVAATRPLRCPAPGTVGIVRTYFDNGDVSVVQHPTSGVRAKCHPDWLEVVGYWRGLTPELVKEILGLTTS